MTRAKDRLYVCGTLKRTTDTVKSWHALVTTALEAECVRRGGPDGMVELDWRGPPERAAPAKGKQEAMAFAPQRPAWLETDAPSAPLPIRRITPSTAVPEPSEGAFRRRPSPLVHGAAADLAAERGRLIHRLLQSLPEVPPEERDLIGRRYLDVLAADWGEADRAALLGEVIGILDDPAFAPVFAAGSRAEVEIAGTLGESRLSGRIDRLAVTADHVLLVDYKTNRPAPETPADTPHDYVIQLALYALILKRLYPGRALVAAILWTDRPALMEIPSDMLDAAAKEAAGTAGDAPSGGPDIAATAP